MSYKYVLNVYDVGFTDGLYFTLNIHTIYFNMFNTHLYMYDMRLHNISLIDIFFRYSECTIKEESKNPEFEEEKRK